MLEKKEKFEIRLKMVIERNETARFDREREYEKK